MSPKPPRPPAGSPIGRPLRLWFGVELFFAIAASISIGLNPSLTASNFAWTIRPEVMAAAMGSFYLALAPVGVLVLLARRWEAVRVFVLAGMVFTFVQLVVTVLHWDRFAVGTAPFALWFASYLLPPPVFLGCWLWQRRRAVPRDGPPLPAWVRRLLRGAGLLFLLEAVIALAWPASFGAWGPWPITPLNARALGGFFVLAGLMAWLIARENDRDDVRLMSPFLLAMLPVFVLQVMRYASQVDWSHPRLWAWLGGMGAVMVAGGVLARGDWRRSLR